jgi:DNA replication protein DnaC
MIMPETITYQSTKFPFFDCLRVLEESGKKIYGINFQILEKDHQVFFKLLVYFLRDEENAKLLNISFRKGILLTGPIGCGKTSLMNLMRFISVSKNAHIMVSTREVSFQFIQEGYSVIQKYSDQAFVRNSQNRKPKIYCFDDLGAENTLKYFGNDCNVMAEILLSRYDHFVSYKMITHITTNLNSTELENIYGNRVRSRLRETCNLISFDRSASDKRK